jgi:hypothetical protein
MEPQSSLLKGKGIVKIWMGLLLSIINKMQRYTIFFITVNDLHVPGGFSAHHQELKTVRTASGVSLLAATASVSSKQVPDDGRRNRLKYIEH